MSEDTQAPLGAENHGDIEQVLGHTISEDQCTEIHRIIHRRFNINMDQHIEDVIAAGLLAKDMEEHT